MRKQSVSLDMMLAARDRRVQVQNGMLAKAIDTGKACVVCLTLNIAGDVKRTPMTRMLFERGKAELERLGLNVIEFYEADGPTGSEAFWLLEEDASAVKPALERIEEGYFGDCDTTCKAARLFDFDVLIASEVSDFEKSFINEDNAASYFEGKDGRLMKAEKISREGQRKCLICDRPAAECARSRNHGLDAIRQATFDLLSDFCAETLGGAAYGALLSELYTSPKPGLVDLNNNGAHSDMDVPLFEKSAAALIPYFKDAALMGIKGCNMAELRERGLAAEQAMFAATGGVNTHKGMVYSMGLLLAGMGKTLTGEPGGSFYDKAIEHAAALASSDAKEALAKSLQDPLTNGALVLKNYGVKGATGHAAAGFPDAVYCAERLIHHSKQFEDPKARASVMKSGPENTNLLHRGGPGALALCDSMVRLEDTNLLHRGGPEGLAFARERASKIAAMPSLEDRLAALEQLDKEMIEKNLSPGGSADMLALAYLLKTWKELSKDL